MSDAWIGLFRGGGAGAAFSHVELGPRAAADIEVEAIAIRANDGVRMLNPPGFGAVGMV